MEWSEQARELLKEVPFFVRPAVRGRIEAMARDAGLNSIDADFYSEAKAKFGQKK
ncbi:MAG: PCP reductase family protein [Synechococcus lacustris]